MSVSPTATRATNSPLTLIIAAALAVFPATAGAWGPAMHVREAERTLQVLREVDDQWDILVQSDPLARQYLRLGAISPDFQHGSAELTFGHSKALSYHLLESAPDDRADLKLFALGHLIHLAGDATAEAFVSPWVWAAHPLGMYDLFVGGDGQVGESETIMEGFSEITLGSWDPVIDVLYDFHLEGEEAQARMDAILEWYCEQGKALTGGDNDCDQVRAEVVDKLATANEILGALGREEAKVFFGDILNKPPDELVWLFTGGLLQSLIGSELNASAHQPWEVRRFLHDVFGDEEWWGFYDESFESMAANFTRDHLATRNTGWPAWNAGALGGGNHQSVMLHLPETYAYGEGLIVDDLHWTDSDGDPVTAIPAGDGAGRYAAQIRLFATLPIAGAVHAVVRKDRPGFAATDDEVIGEATLQIDIDPLTYTTTARSVITVEFDAQPDDALGFYVELTLNDEPRPWFTSSWDQLWSIEEAPLFWQMYRNNFGTYQRFPGSLPYAEPAVGTGALFVAVRYDVADLALPDARVTVDGGEPVRVGSNGVAVFDALPPGQHQAEATFPGVDGTATLSVEVTAGGEAWVDLDLGGPPVVSAPAWATTGCVPLTWDPVMVGWPLATALWARLAGDEEWTDLAVLEEPALCVEVPDGEKVSVELRIEFGEGRSPEIAKTGEVAFDASPPELGDLDVSHNCGATAVGVSVAETHSELTGLQWQLGDGEWNDLTLDANSFGFGTPHTAERRLTVKATNSAGLEASVEAMVRGPAGCGDPAPAPDETDGDGPPDPVTPADPPTDVEGAKISGGGGCATVLPTALVAWGPIRR